MTLPSPVLSEGELELLEGDPIFKSSTLPIFFDISGGVEGSLQKALNSLCEAADEAVRAGSQLLILSDRSDEPVQFTPFLSVIWISNMSEMLPAVFFAQFTRTANLS